MLINGYQLLQKSGRTQLHISMSEGGYQLIRPDGTVMSWHAEGRLISVDTEIVWDGEVHLDSRMNEAERKFCRFYWDGKPFSALYELGIGIEALPDLDWSKAIWASLSRKGDYPLWKGAFLAKEEEGTYFIGIPQSSRGFTRAQTAPPIHRLVEVDKAVFLWAAKYSPIEEQVKQMVS